MKNLKKLFGFMVVLMVVITSFCSVSFAATGVQLAGGWQRFDDTDSAITYTGKYEFAKFSSYYKGSSMRIATNNMEGSAQFYFYGSKLRILSSGNSHGFSQNVQIKIDGNIVGSYSSLRSLAYKIIVFTATDLTLGIHKVEITPLDHTTYGTILDAVDIDDTGYLVSIPAPTNLTAEADSNEVTLNWTSVEGATSYNIKRGTTSGGEYATIGTNTTNSAITFTDIGQIGGIENGTTYYYVVSAIVNGIEGPNSIEVSATPMQVIPLPPTSLIADVGDEYVELRWNPVENATSYNVKRALTIDGEYNDYALNVTSNSFLDTEVTNGDTYYYVVSVNVGGVESPNSNIVSATPYSEVVIGNNAILEITMLNGASKEYDLTSSEIQDFLMWYDSRSEGIGKAFYTFVNKGIVSPFLKKSEYVPFDKILYFEVNEYAS